MIFHKLNIQSSIRSAMKTIYLKPFRFQGKARIAILFNYEKSIIEKVRLIPGRIWSAENRLWHIPYTKEKLKSLKFYLTSVDIIIDDSAFRVKEGNAKYSSTQIISKLELPKVHEAHIDRFRIWLKSKRYSERTCDTYVGLIKSFFKFFSNKVIEDITK